MMTLMAEEAPEPEDADPDSEGSRSEDHAARVQRSREQQAEEEEEEVGPEHGAVVGLDEERVELLCGAPCLNGRGHVVDERELRSQVLPLERRVRIRQAAGDRNQAGKADGDDVRKEEGIISPKRGER